MDKQKNTTKNASFSSARKSRKSGTTTPPTTPTQATQDTSKHNNICTQTNKQYLQLKIQDFVITQNIDSLQKVAISVVKKVCLKYAPNNTQTMQLYNDSRHPNTQNADVKDLRQVAIYSILEQLHQQKDTPPQQIDYTTIFKNTFSAINKYLYHLRGINLSCRPFDYSIEQIQENGLDILINVKKGINQIVKDSSITNINDYTNDNDTNDTNKKRQLVIDILKTLTPTQKQVAKLLALGYNHTQIANKLKRTRQTILEHIKLIKNKANKIVNNQ